MTAALLNGAAFYKQPKIFKILPALFFVSLSLPAGRDQGQLELAILIPAFFSTFQFPQEPLLPCYC